MQLMQKCNTANIQRMKSMPIPRDTNAKPVEGMRARKRRQTRERITNAAMNLFLKRGFDAVTVDEIAAAADVSTRSFFDYFPAKEDLISAWQDDFGVAVAAAVTARPPGEPLVRVVEAAVTSAILAAAQPREFAIADLVSNTPSLGARRHLKYGKLEQMLADALVQRVHSEADRFRARLLAMIVVGAMRLGDDIWREQERSYTSASDMHAFVKQMFQTVWVHLREFGAAD
jgi:AcrR family transcriptional regulator